LRKNLFLLLRLLLLLLRRVRRFWGKRIAHFDLLFQVVIVFSCRLGLVVSLLLLLGRFRTGHHTGDSRGATCIHEGALGADCGGRSDLGLGAGWFLHAGLEIVHVSRRLIYLLDGRNLISSFGSFRYVKVACWLYRN
jgi:hypothetical protein